MTENRLLWKSGRAIARILTRLLFDLKVDGAENLPDHGGALLVSNHQSLLDPVLLGVGLNRPLSYIAKSELFEIAAPITWLIRELGGFPVRQGKEGGDIAASGDGVLSCSEGVGGLIWRP